MSLILRLDGTASLIPSTVDSQSKVKIKIGEQATTAKAELKRAENEGKNILQSDKKDN